MLLGETMLTVTDALSLQPAALVATTFHVVVAVGVATTVAQVSQSKPADGVHRSRIGRGSPAESAIAFSGRLPPVQMEVSRVRRIVGGGTTVTTTVSSAVCRQSGSPCPVTM